MAKECYLASMKQKTVDNVYLDELDMRDEVHTQPEPSEELEPVSLDDDPEHLAYIGSKTSEAPYPFLETEQRRLCMEVGRYGRN